MMFANINLEKFKDTISNFKLREQSLYDMYVEEHGEDSYEVSDSKGHVYEFVVKKFYIHLDQNFIGGVRADFDWAKFLKSEANK